MGSDAAVRRAARRAAFILGGALAIAAGPGAWATPPSPPWAVEVMDYLAIDSTPGFNNPQNAVGAPVGGGSNFPDNSKIHSIGTAGSYIVLRFDPPVQNDPRNPMGLDCIVYGNAFWIGGNPKRRWIEPGLLQISEDVNGNGIPDDPWYTIPGSRNLDPSIFPGGLQNPVPPFAGNVLNPNPDNQEFDWGYADLSPTLQPYLDNYLRPSDPFTVGVTHRSGGGDAFDISWAVDDDGNPANLTQFHFLRITTIVAADAGELGAITTEITGAAAVAPLVDRDGNGILDMYEERVAGTDPLRPENTVLALEIPFEFGGSPEGAPLGTAWDWNGNEMSFFSTGLRTGARNFNCIVDILPQTPPPGAIPGLLKSGAAVRFESSEPDFTAAQIDHAAITIAYSAEAVAGLDESALSVWRHSANGYTQDGITDIAPDPDRNRVHFRSRYPGVFAIAGPTGPGSLNGDPGVVSLSVNPGAADAGSGAVIAVESAPLIAPGQGPLADGTLITVFASHGEILEPDLDPDTPGIQRPVADQRIAFSVETPETPGAARFRIRTLDGELHGGADFLFGAGAPEAPVPLILLNPELRAPGIARFQSALLQTPSGVLLPDGQLLTVAADGGALLTPDAAPALDGHQAAVQNGRIAFEIEVDAPAPEDKFAPTGFSELWVSLYAESTQDTLLAMESFVFPYVDPATLPMRGAPAAAAVALLAAGLWRRRRRNP